MMETLTQIQTNWARIIQIKVPEPSNRHIYLVVESLGTTGDRIQSALTKEDALDIAASIIRHYNNA
jgi:phenylacetate-coenzyme A ligase PaaK-like adenylate-forming protein